MYGLFASLVALTPALGVPAALPAVTEPAPTAVTVAWSSPAHHDVVVTWQETGDVRNRVEVVRADGTPLPDASVIVEAGRPNESPLPSVGPNQTLRVVVLVVDADGNAISDPASSPAFDTDRAPSPVLKTVVPHEDGTITMSWGAVPYHDATPGDPLDLPADDPQRWIPFASIFDLNGYVDLSGPTTETSIVVSREVPVVLAVRNIPNEWGGYAADGTEVWRSRLTASIPHTATTGGKLTVTGKSFRGIHACDPGPCWVEESPDDAGRPVRLEARTGASADWQTVASTRTSAGGGFTFKVTFPGARDYRVVAPAIALAKDQTPRSYAVTAATSVKVVTGGGSSGGTGGGGGLPITGAPVAWIAATGGVLLAVGVLLATLGRARRRGAPTPDDTPSGVAGS